MSLGFQLTEEQTEAKRLILNFFNNGSRSDDDRFFTLCGAAGTGKTTVLQEILKAINPNRKITMTAPTHKAVSVIRQMMFDHNVDNVDHITTIHSALGLKMTYKYGEEILVKDPRRRSPDMDILFIDESSMLDDDLIDFILESNARHVLFIGDECQIAPVDYEPGEVSRVFTEVTSIYRLNKVVRQAADNPIISLATTFREQQALCAQWPAIADIYNNSGGVIVRDTKDWEMLFLHNLDIGDHDHCRAIAYTNKECGYLNRLARRHLYGLDAPEFVVGETIVATRSHEKTGYKNNEELLIKEISESRDIRNELDVWVIQALGSGGNIYELRIVKDYHVVKLDSQLEVLSNVAKAETKQGDGWKTFWELKNRFDYVGYIYAITCHKSQGSTFKHTFIRTPDIMRFGVNLSTLQLLYTATTRSSFATYFDTGR